MDKNKSQLTLYLKKTNAKQFNINYKRRSVKGAVACLIGRWQLVASVPSVAFVALRTLRALRWMETPLYTPVDLFLE